MSSSIDTLKQLMPPPTEPLYPGSRMEWIAFRKKVGLSFPEDYFTLVNAYGSGRFLAGEFKVANPFDPDDGGFADSELRTLREIKSNCAEEVPYSLFPEAGGLYPFAIDGNGNTFLWRTDGDSEMWAIACHNSEDYWEIVSDSVVEFVVLLATNQLNINRRKYWGSDFSEEHLEFIPRQLRARRKKSVR